MLIPIAVLVVRLALPLTLLLINSSVFQDQSNHLMCCPVSVETGEVWLLFFGLQTVNYAISVIRVLTKAIMSAII